MKALLMATMLVSSLASLAGESIGYDDGIGAQIEYYLSAHGMHEGLDVKYTTFRISVIKEGKFLFFTDLSGTKTEDGEAFFGRIIIPSGMVDSAEILTAGSYTDSARGVSTTTTVSAFTKIAREKSWTTQE